MPEFIAKVPFLRLLLPLAGGILLQYYFDIVIWGIFLIGFGIILITISLFINPNRHYNWRWLFGAGIYLFFFSIGIFGTLLKQTQTAFSFSTDNISYKGTITDIPQQKPKSIACEIQLDNPDKKIICYLQNGVRSKKLKAGDEIMFFGKIKHFKHFGDPNDFDYPKYMYNRGFAGTIYLFSDDWEATGNRDHSLWTFALDCRQSILNFYRLLELNEEEYSILAALTIGYKDSLSEDLKESFKATGTSHILALSGLHVGIIYGAIIFLFSLFRISSKTNRLAQVLIIACLWVYVFITGLSPSVIRASIVLSIFCIANIFERKGITYNNVFIAAFLMLLWNPFFLFDVGFQLSFSAVLSICFFYPKLSGSITLKNKYLKSVWNLFTLSIAAQLGTFPICLYYFGTFPSYFFITNLLVVPLVSVIIYIAILLSLLALTGNILPPFLSDIINFIPLNLLKITIGCMTGIIHFFETLPFALIEGVKISLSSVFILICLIVTLFLFFIKRKTRIFIYSLSLILLSLIIYIGTTYIFPQNIFSIYQEENKTRIAWNKGKEIFYLEKIDNYNLVIIGNKKFLAISGDAWKNQVSKEPFYIDYLYIHKTDSLSLYSLTQIFDIGNILIDPSLSTNKKRKIISECKKLNIAYCDIGEKGLFRINF